MKIILCLALALLQKAEKHCHKLDKHRTVSAQYYDTIKLLKFVQRWSNHSLAKVWHFGGLSGTERPHGTFHQVNRNTINREPVLHSKVLPNMGKHQTEKIILSPLYTQDLLAVSRHPSYQRSVFGVT